MFVCHIFGRQIFQPFKAVIKVENTIAAPKIIHLVVKQKSTQNNAILVGDIIRGVVSGTHAAHRKRFCNDMKRRSEEKKKRRRERKEIHL